MHQADGLLKVKQTRGVASGNIVTTDFNPLRDMRQADGLLKAKQTRGVASGNIVTTDFNPLKKDAINKKRTIGSAHLNKKLKLI